MVTGSVQLKWIVTLLSRWGPGRNHKGPYERAEEDMTV